jgi:hypothetical protein
MRLMSLSFAVVVMAAISTGPSPAAFAQEFRVENQTVRLSGLNSDVQQVKYSKEVLCESQTLFHVGKVYDYIREEQELTVLDRAWQQVLLINERKKIGVRISCQELDAALQRHELDAQQALRKRAFDGRSDAARIRMVQFQLDPHFTVTQNKNRLTLSSDVLTYDIQCEDPRGGEHLAEYLSYADWMSQLNYAMNPTAMGPRPRLKVNGELQRIHKLPSVVRLRKADDSRGTAIETRHVFHWSLNATDLKRLRYYESLQGKDSRIKWLDRLSEYYAETRGPTGRGGK